MISRTLALGATLTLALVAHAAPQDMVGEAAPDAQIKEWVKGNACNSFRDLRGKAILIEFFATW